MQSVLSPTIISPFLYKLLEAPIIWAFVEESFENFKANFLKGSVTLNPTPELKKSLTKFSKSSSSTRYFPNEILIFC